MTTKEFIKMLQDADPTGEGHIRMEGGIPYAAIEKEGYWDGPYSYIDKDGNYVYTTKGYKVDIYCTDVYDFVEENFSRGKTKWEDIEPKFKFELGSNKIPHVAEKEDRILKKARDAYDSISEVEERLYDKALTEMKENSEKGWTWFQNKKIDTERGMHVYYTWKIYDESGKEKGSNIWMTECVQDSGLWERVDNNKVDGYYVWIFKK